MRAEKLLDEEKYDLASQAFKNAGAYSYATERIGEPYYLQAEGLIEDEKHNEAVKTSHAVGLQADGSVVAAGFNEDG